MTFPTVLPHFGWTLRCPDYFTFPSSSSFISPLILFRFLTPWSAEHRSWLTQNPLDLQNMAEKKGKKRKHELVWIWKNLLVRYWVFVSSRVILYQDDSSQRAWLTVRGAMEVYLRWWFYWRHQGTRRPPLGRDVGCLAWLAGERERETGSESKGAKRVGWGIRQYAGTQRGRGVSPRATGRHLRLERSIPCQKQLRLLLVNSIYWFGTGVNRRDVYSRYSPISTLFQLLKQKYHLLRDFFTHSPFCLM